jgi:dihydrofolate reductase
VTDGIENAIRQAKAAAGHKDITIIGTASTAQQCLKAGLADELHIQVVPIIVPSSHTLNRFSKLCRPNQPDIR